MPPSPALRCSPGREHRMGSTHKRGHSLESGLHPKAKDDDLALFNDMQNRERDNFLLHMADDFDDSISKLKYFSDYKLGVTIPVRGESSDLLNVDGEKNDYDWLLTPPDTPLFSSLDDDEHQLVNLATRGRPRTQPIPISRSSMTEKTPRTSRSSASPHRLSPSPRSSNSVMQSRRRPSSAPHSSPSPVSRPATPSRRPSTPPNKPSTTGPRSSTPPFRRMSTGSNGQPSSSGRRGLSPVKTSRGNSASPKLRGWQAELPGFSSEAPPNLRTSLSDRQASHTRGLSPASSNGRDSSSNLGRRSMSPAASRSSSSSRSQGRDRFSSNSKHSAASLGDDDVDSLHSVSAGISVSSTARINGVAANNRAIALSKKLSRTPSSSSAPKRSFDSALRQMDHRKAPQNMFRPLMSSVPATSFYVGKVNSLHRPMFSRNSSLTTSSNASSEQGVSTAQDMDGSDGEQNDLTGHWEKLQNPDTQEEVFTFDKVDEMDEDIGHEVSAGESRHDLGNTDGGMTSKVKLEDFENLTVGVATSSKSFPSASESSYAAGDHSAVDCYGMMTTCSICGKCFQNMAVDGNADMCEKCAERDGRSDIGVSGTTLITHYGALQSALPLETNRLCSQSQVATGVPVLPDRNSGQLMSGQPERDLDHGSDCLVDSCLLQSVMDEKKQHLSDWQPDIQQEVNAAQSYGYSKFPPSENSAHSSLRADSSEGAGISVLLQRSSSNKWPVVRGRAFQAANIPYSEPSYVRDNMSAMKRSIGRDSASTSSSIDLGSSRPREDYFLQQLSRQKDEMDDSRSDGNTKSQSTVLSFPGDTINPFAALIDSKSEARDDFGGLECGPSEEKMSITEERDINLENTGLIDKQFLSTKQVFQDEDISSYANYSMETDCSASQLVSNSQSSFLKDATMADYPNDNRVVPCMNAEDLHCNDGNITEVTVDVLDSSDDFVMVSDGACKIDNSDVAALDSLGLEHDHCSHQHSQTEVTTSQNPIDIEASHDCSGSTASEKDAPVCASESSTVDHFHDIHEEPTLVMLGGPRGHMSRSLTLEEATDTVLFCSSLVHDLAYKAATIGMEKEEMVLPEASRPTFTILGKSVSDNRDSHSIFSSKRTPKAQKAKRKRLEADTMPLSPELNNNAKIKESTPSKAEIPSRVDSSKPPKLESKCNCTVM